MNLAPAGFEARGESKDSSISSALENGRLQMFRVTTSAAPDSPIVGCAPMRQRSREAQRGDQLGDRCCCTGSSEEHHVLCRSARNLSWGAKKILDGFYASNSAARPSATLIVFKVIRHVDMYKVSQISSSSLLPLLRRLLAPMQHVVVVRDEMTCRTCHGYKTQNHRRNR